VRLVVSQSDHDSLVFKEAGALTARKAKVISGTLTLAGSDG
jgi:hypothetical protein